MEKEAVKLFTNTSVQNVNIFIQDLQQVRLRKIMYYVQPNM